MKRYSVKEGPTGVLELTDDAGHIFSHLNVFLSLKLFVDVINNSHLFFPFSSIIGRE